MTPSANVVPIITKSTATVPWSEVEPLLQVQQHQPKTITFSHQDLADIFGLTLGLILPGTSLHALQIKLAKALAEPLP